VAKKKKMLDVTGQGENSRGMTLINFSLWYLGSWTVNRFRIVSAEIYSQLS
jgi:hypothetical protein